MSTITIPIVMICDDNFVMQTCVALISLRLNQALQTNYDIYVIEVECNTNSIKQIQSMNSEQFNITIIHTSLNKYKNIKQLAHVPLASLLKFDICDLIPQYDKLLYLDGDIMVRQDLSSLFLTDLEDNYVAGIAHSIGALTGAKKINGGVLLFNASKIRNEGLRDEFLKTRLSLGDRRSMDQETFHVVFGEQKCFLFPQYNVMIDKIDYEKKFYSLKKYNLFYGTNYSNRKEIIDTAVIIHFTGSVKPWKYKFTRCSKEWYGYYQKLFGSKDPLKRKGMLRYIVDNVSNNGPRSLYWMIKDKILEFMGEYFNLYLDQTREEWN